MNTERCRSCGSDRIIDNGFNLACLECKFVDSDRLIEDNQDLILAKPKEETIIL